MRTLLVIVNLLLAVAIIQGVRWAMMVPRYDYRAAGRAADGVMIPLTIMIGLNVVYFLVTRRKRIASAGISGAAMGVRLSRKARAKAEGLRQKIIDKADNP